MDRSCYLNFKKAGKEYFRENRNSTKEESIKYATEHTINALYEAVVHNDFNYFSREEKVREQLIECGQRKIQIELLNHVVKTYSYYKENESPKVKYLSYDLSKETDYNEMLCIVYLNLVKYGMDRISDILGSAAIMKLLAESFVLERLVYNNKNAIDAVSNDVSAFLLASIHSYFAQIKE